MRLVIHGAPPTAQSGYGVELGLAAKALQELGHDVAISCYAGWFLEPEWNGMPVMSCGSRLNGNGLIKYNAARWKADALILLGDLWTFVPPGQFRELRVLPWIPLDTDPIGVMDRQCLAEIKGCAELHPVAMSEFGARVLDEAGFPGCAVVPHCADPAFAPDPIAGMIWRKTLDIPREAFVISKVGVNNEDDRKCFEVTLQAFALFAKKHENSLLYLHTEGQPQKGPNLVLMASHLGLRGKVAFADPLKRAADLYSTADMQAIYSGSQVLDAVSRGEGFGVPPVEALRCGTPVIGCRNSAMAEKVKPGHGWLVHGQKTWARHHQSWWVTPSVTDLARAYEQAYSSARSMRKAAVLAGERWSFDAMRLAWEKALVSVG